MKKLFIVDDDPGIVKMIGLIFEMKGFEVFSASNGKEAVEKLERIVPDIMLLDLMMPEMDGFQVLSRLKESESKKFPVIVFSAVEEKKSRRKALDLGADLYIVKGTEPDKLVRIVIEAADGQ